MAYSLSTADAKAYYKRIGAEWQQLDEIPLGKMTIDQLNRQERIGDIQSDLEIQYGLDFLKQGAAK